MRLGEFIYVYVWPERKTTRVFTYYLDSCTIVRLQVLFRHGAEKKQLLSFFLCFIILVILVMVNHISDIDTEGEREVQATIGGFDLVRGSHQTLLNQSEFENPNWHRNVTVTATRNWNLLQQYSLLQNVGD